MKLILYIGLTVLVIASVAGCAAYLQKGDAGPITGTWTGMSQFGSEVTMTFKKNYTMSMVINTHEGPVQTKARYRIDYSQNPASLDVYDILIPEGLSATELHAVVSFPAENRMIYNGAYVVKGADKQSGNNRSVLHAELERTDTSPIQ